MNKVVSIKKQGNLYCVFIVEGTNQPYCRYGSSHKIEALAYAFGYCDAIQSSVLYDETL